MPVVKSNVIRRRVEFVRPEKLARQLSLKDFYAKRNKILVIRGCGGLGDILMHRMIFEDFKRLMPDAEIHFACPSYYQDAINDHPFVDKVLPIEQVDRFSYVVSYNTTTACGRAEMKLAPLAGSHRSDIWAAHCGLILTKHNMHFRFKEQEIEEAKKLISSRRNREGPIVLVCPISAMDNKNLRDNQLLGVIKGLIDRNLCPIGLHSNPIYPMLKNDIPVFHGLNLRQWLSVINEADYMVSVDTAAFHAAGGLKKPVVGIFTFINGATYSKHYPTAEVVQGPCSAGFAGCYNWGACPVTSLNPKPCLTEITTEMILSKVDQMLTKCSKTDIPNSIRSGDKNATNAPIGEN